VNYQEKTLIVEQREWDLQTTTAGDYTLQMTISKHQVEEIKSKLKFTEYLDGQPMGLRIKGFIAKAFEEEHKRLEPEGQDLRVAEINFFFKNTPLIDMLKARATAINGKNWNKVKQINQQMTDEVQRDPVAICTPIGAFVTFHDEYSYN
jgi:hypothetical protein